MTRRRPSFTRLLSTSFRHRYIALLVVVGLSGCLSFDEEGYLTFTPPVFTSPSDETAEWLEYFNPEDTQAIQDFCIECYRALRDSNPDSLARLKPYAISLAKNPANLSLAQPYATWIQSRLPYFDAVEVNPAPRSTSQRPTQKTAPPPQKRGSSFWRKTLQSNPPPKRASALIPQLEAIFLSEGVPPQLVWMAEVESSFDPSAKSPVGALGLFQLMPKTAQSLGLSLTPQDQRLIPQQNARAAARYLKKLYRRFGSWPLTLAAYNAGEGRIAKLSKQLHSNQFSTLAPHLPTETQLYVPRVLETIARRTGTPPHAIPPPHY